MKPKSKYLTKENNRREMEKRERAQSQQSQSRHNINKKATVNHPNPTTSSGIVKSLINYFENG